MRSVEDISGLLAGPHSWRPRISAWYDGELVADDVPLQSGDLRWTGSNLVPERLTGTVPSKWAGRSSWVPSRASDPLSEKGTRLHVAVEVASGARSVLVPISWYRIEDWRDTPERVIRVEAVGLAQIVLDDRLLTPSAPAIGATLTSELTRLMPAGMPVEVDPAVVNRAAPRALAFSGDRLAALYDIADAWPARLRWDSGGVARILPPLGDTPGEPVLELVDGEDGTVVSAPVAGSRDGIYNAAVVVGQAESPGDPEPRAVAYFNHPTSPLRWGGPFGNKVAPEFFSPLMTTLAQCQAAASTRLANLMRATRLIHVSAVADPRVELDDVVAVTREGRRWVGWVVDLGLPGTANDQGGVMQLTLGVPNVDTR